MARAGTAGRGAENLCPRSVFTGWDIHGGYAEYLVAADAYVHALPTGFSDAQAAPLLMRRDHRIPGPAPALSCRPAARSGSGGSAARLT